jgi:hypothetical protein
LLSYNILAEDYFQKRFARLLNAANSSIYLRHAWGPNVYCTPQPSLTIALKSQTTGYLHLATLSTLRKTVHRSYSIDRSGCCQCRLHYV